MGTLVLEVLWYTAFVHCIQYLIGNVQGQSAQCL